MSWRLTISNGTALAVQEYAEQGDVQDALAGALQPGVTLAVVQELDAPEPSTWGQVRQGDEVVAPDGSLWWVDTIVDDDMPRPVGLTSLDGQRQLAFNVTDDMPIMRRPGVLSAAAQLLHDVGLWSGR